MLKRSGQETDRVIGRLHASSMISCQISMGRRGIEESVKRMFMLHSQTSLYSSFLTKLSSESDLLFRILLFNESSLLNRFISEFLGISK